MIRASKLVNKINLNTFNNNIQNLSKIFNDLDNIDMSDLNNKILATLKVSINFKKFAKPLSEIVLY